MKIESLVLVGSLLLVGPLLAAEPAHALRQRGGITFHYGVVPAQVVLAHADQHPERRMHGGAAPKGGASHVVVALFDAAKGERIAQAEVIATVTVVGGASVTKRLEPMTIADQPSFGGFFQLGIPGIYRLRFEARRPGAAEAASAEFEYRVSPQGRR